MSSPKRKRDVPVLFWVSADEMELIQQKMAQFGTKNLSAYLRKMAVDGYVVQLDLPELKEHTPWYALLSCPLMGIEY